MDQRRFDRWTRDLATASLPRRRALGGLLGSGFGGLLALSYSEARAKKKKGKKKKNKGPCGNGCQGGATCCPGGCAVLGVDPNNCGGCGKTCTPDESCLNGQCVFCKFPKQVCGALCVDVQTDANNCAQCGVICPRHPQTAARNFICEGGQCKCSGRVCDNGECCPAGFKECIGGGAGCCPDGYPISCPGGRCCPAAFPNCNGTCGQPCCK